MVLKQRGFDNQAVMKFENDVKMYGTQARPRIFPEDLLFENDVKMYGTQEAASITS